MIKQAIHDNKILNQYLIQSSYVLEIPEVNQDEHANKSDISLQTPNKYRQKKINKKLRNCQLTEAQKYYILRKYSFNDIDDIKIDEICQRELRKVKSFEDLLSQKNKKREDIPLVQFSDSHVTEAKIEQQGDVLIEIYSIDIQQTSSCQVKNAEPSQKSEMDLSEENEQEIQEDAFNGISQINNQQQFEQDSESPSFNDIMGHMAVCAICRSSSAYEEILKLLECEHKFCKQCYKEYLEEKIKIAKISNIPCPEEGCVQKFTEAIIESIVSQEKFNQYLTFKRKQEIENDPNKKWCPAIGCDKYVTKDPKNSIVQCECGTIVCFNCGKLQHPGLLCEQVIETDFILAINKYKMKYCPNCKSHIEKNAGCNHMTCIKCSFQFCWVCLQPYHQYHYRYWSIKGCAIWSNGRFKTSKVISDPDKMRHIYYAPRLILYILRGPLIIVKLTLNAAGKAFFTPLRKMNKRMIKGKKPKSCLCAAFYILIMELIIIILVIILFPFIFLFYRIPKEIQWIQIKGCAY